MWGPRINSLISWANAEFNSFLRQAIVNILGRSSRSIVKERHLGTVEVSRDPSAKHSFEFFTVGVLVQLPSTSTNTRVSQRSPFITGYPRDPLSSHHLVIQGGSGLFWDIKSSSTSQEVSRCHHVWLSGHLLSALVIKSWASNCRQSILTHQSCLHLSGQTSGSSQQPNQEVQGHHTHTHHNSRILAASASIKQAVSHHSINHIRRHINQVTTDRTAEIRHTP